jgi:hypothetical protein
MPDTKTPPKQATDRVEVTMRGFAERATPGQPTIVDTSHGQVRIGAAVSRVVGGTGCVEIWMEGQPPTDAPAFRIFNPPLLVADPKGDILCGGRTYRQDPVAAVAELIARHTPARRPRR